MGDSDGEIEYLDEDEDLVKQSVQFANKNYVPLVKEEIPEPKPTPRNEYQRTIAERSRNKRRRSIYEEEDSDYDPTEDIRIAKGIKPIKHRPKSLTRHHESWPISQPKKIQTMDREDLPNIAKKEIKRAENKETILEMMAKRRGLDITIPEYDDPLCLPVRVVSKNKNEINRLKKWNDLCLRYYQRYSELQKNIVTSSRSLSFQCQKNLRSDAHETVVSGKVIFKDTYRKTKVEEYRGVLPNYREIKVLKYPILKDYDAEDSSEETKVVTTVILSKEMQNNKKCLTVYKPNDAVTAIYCSAMEKVNPEDPTDQEVRKFLQEKVLCRVCPTCYQMCNRPAADVKDDRPMQCAVCSRNFTSAYNLIRHVKTHAKKDVLPKQEAISAILSAKMNYHYNCQICEQNCKTIIELRNHMKAHEVSESFECDVCNQYVMAG